MSWTQPYFQSQIAHNGLVFRWYPNVKAELTLMSTAVKADLTKHDKTIETPLGILQNPNTRYQQQINRVINRGKAGNLSAAQMGAAMDAVVAQMP